MKNKVVRKLLMIGLSSSVALTSTVGVTAASMDTALEAVAEDETETETETDSEEDVAEETEETEETLTEVDGTETENAGGEEPGPGIPTIEVTVIYVKENGEDVTKKTIYVADEDNDGFGSIDATSIEGLENYEIVSIEGEDSIDASAPYIYVTVKAKEEASSDKIDVNIDFQDDAGESVGKGKISGLDVYHTDSETGTKYYQFNTSIVEDQVPEGYKIPSFGDVSVTDIKDGVGSATVHVQKVEAATQEIRVDYVDDKGNNILTSSIVVNKNTTYINTSILADSLPYGWELETLGDVNIVNGAVTVIVKEKAYTDDVIINYVDEEGNNVLTSSIKVYKDTKYFNTSILKDVPHGWELVTLGDVSIIDGKATVVVKQKEYTKDVIVNYVDAEGNNVLTSSIRVDKDTTYFNTSILQDVPYGWELETLGDVTITDGKVTVVVKQKAYTKDVVVNYVDAEGNNVLTSSIRVDKDTTYFNTSILQDVPYGWELETLGDVTITDGKVTVVVKQKEYKRDVIVNYVDAEGNNVLTSSIRLDEGVTYFNTSILKDVPYGWILANVGDVQIEGNTATVVVRPKTYTKDVIVNYVDEEGNNVLTSNIKLEEDATYFNTSILKDVPYGWELATLGDVQIEGNTATVVVRQKVTEKTVYVSYIDEETKMPFENGIEEIKVAADATSFNTSILTKVPAGYELCITGDIAFEGDSVNVEVRKAEKSVYVSYIDEETKMPLENAIEEIKLAADATSFNTSVLAAVPAGYELCAVGDVYIGENDTVNVEVRKVVTERTVYVSYIDEETKMPFENGIEEIKVAADATTFNTSVLTAVPAGYELCETGDVYIGENDTVNVEVRKSVVREKDIVIGYVDEKDGTEIAVSQITIPEDATYFNTSMLTDVPEGYELVTVGDIWLGSATVAEVQVRKIENVQDVTVQYVTEDGEVVGTGALQLDADATYVNTNALTDVPEGYVVAIVGDLPIEDGTVVVTVRLAETDPENPTPTPDPENPENPDPETPDPENPTPEPENPDQPTNPQPTTRPENNNNNNNNTNTNQNQAQTQTRNPRTGDMTNTMPLFAGLLGSGAMIGLIQRLRRRKDDK